MSLISRTGVCLWIEDFTILKDTVLQRLFSLSGIRVFSSFENENSPFSNTGGKGDLSCNMTLPLERDTLDKSATCDIEGKMRNWLQPVELTTGIRPKI